MGQETGTWQSETNLEREKHEGRQKDESATGRDTPGGDGTVGDEQVNAIGKQKDSQPTGQDHSTEHHETTDADHGVGTIQESSAPTTDVAHIDE